MPYGRGMVIRHVGGAADQGLALNLQWGHRICARYDADGKAAVGPAVAQQGKGRDLRFGGKGGDEGKNLIGGQRALPCLGAWSPNVADCSPTRLSIRQG